MTLQSLGNELRKMYLNAAAGEQVVMIHLFGIKTYKEIIDSKISARSIVLEAGIDESDATEVGKGVRLGKYVKPRRTWTPNS